MLLVPLLLSSLLSVACSVGSDAPATPGSASAQEAAQVGELAKEAAEIERLSAELTSLIDESRRQVTAGTSTREAEIAKMRALMQQIDERNTKLQAGLAAVEERVHTAAGDPAWPPEDKDKR
jgi:hypothetical protein